MGSAPRGAGAAVREGVTTAGVPGDAVNESLCLQPHLRAVGGWRGPYSLALQRESQGFVVAMRAIDVGMQMAQEGPPVIRRLLRAQTARELL